MITKDLILVGGGGHCKSVMEVIDGIGLNILGVLDKPELLGKKVVWYNIIGNDDDVPKYTDKCGFVITVGQIKSPNVRIKIYDRIKDANGSLPIIIAVTASVSRLQTVIQEGTVVMHKAIVNAGALVGKCCIINSMVDIEHDVTIGDFTHIATGALINGDCRIGNRCFIGSGSVISNGIQIADDVIVGAGSVVIRDISKPGLYAGNPAIFKKEI